MTKSNEMYDKAMNLITAIAAEDIPESLTGSDADIPAGEVKSIGHIIDFGALTGGTPGRNFEIGFRLNSSEERTIQVTGEALDSADAQSVIAAAVSAQTR